MDFQAIDLNVFFLNPGWFPPSTKHATFAPRTTKPLLGEDVLKKGLCPGFPVEFHRSMTRVFMTQPRYCRKFQDGSCSGQPLSSKNIFKITIYLLLPVLYCCGHPCGCFLAECWVLGDRATPEVATHGNRMQKI